MKNNDQNKRRFPRHTREVEFDGDVKIYKPKNVVPAFETYVVTDNYTDEKGNVYNVSDDNAAFSRRWVDENHK